MRKLLLLSTLTLMTLGGFAQANTEDREVGTTTKAGQKILPQAGDFAIGVDAASFLKFGGNMFNGNTDNKAPKFGYEDGIFGAPAIYGKYFLADDRAVRVKLHLGFASETKKENANGSNGSDITNEKKYSQSGLGLSVGYEIRRGYGRLQGFFGPEVGLGFGSEGRSITYKYGEDLSREYTNGGRERNLKESAANTFQMKVGGFAGVEYFVAPKLSLGAEVGLGIRFASQGDSSKETERWNTNNNVLVKDKEETPGGSAFDFKTVASGALNVTFHF